MTVATMLQLRALGPLEVDIDGRPVAFGGPQQRRLLGVLIVNRARVVSVDHLVDALWPEGDPPSGAARSVLTYVSRLRAALPDGALVTSGAGYRLDPERSLVDIDEFDRLITAAESSLPDRLISLVDQALGMWRGDPFGEFTHDFWAEAETARLVERFACAQEDRAAARLAIGHHARAVPELERLAREHTLRERPVSLLMQALRSADRSAEGLRTFQRFRDHLAEETGLEPSADLTALRDSLYVDSTNDSQIIGRPLRGYTILEAIGEGSFGRVYSATQPGTGRPVAIKAIRPDLADSSDFINRFEAEAQLVARLEHPHIVPLYDYWREPGGAYLVFRLLNGGTARDASIAQGPWSLTRVSRLVEEIGSALLAAHGMGVAHNDVTASNVLLDDAGVAYLSDFGIAMVPDGPDDDGHDGNNSHDGDGTQSAAMLGDIRSFAWLVWELITGDLAPQRSQASTAQRRRPGATPSLIGRVPSVPDGLDAILERATTGAYGTIGEFILAWRAMEGRSSGILSPVTSDERRIVSSERRLAARRLAMQAAAGINPYKGLQPFDEADGAGFFGRAEVVAELIDRVESHRFVAVVGASGSGKSSVVRAGVLPMLRANGWAIAVMSPGDDPLASIGDALVEVSIGDEVELSVGDRLLAIASRTPLLILIDQFEECWTRCPAGDRNEFIALIVAGVERTDTELRVVVTIRADRFDAPLQHPQLGHRMGAASYVLSTMSPTQIGDAVVLPAARAGVAFDDGVVAELVTEASAQPGALPLLQFTLRELYDRRVDGWIGPDQLAATGGMAGSVGRRADDIYASRGGEEPDLVRELFSRLVVPDDHGGFVRRAAWQSELRQGTIDVASDFVDARLLVTDRDVSTREPTIEIAHDALLTNWARLATWVDEDRRWLAVLRTVAASSIIWDEGGRVDADLLRGARLADALDGLDNGRTVSTLELEFLEAGRAHRDAEVVSVRRTSRRLRRLLVVVGVVLIAALVAGAVAIAQRGRAEDASIAARAEADRADDEAARALAAAQRADEEAADALVSAEAATSSAREAAIEGLVGRAESLRAAQRDAAALLSIEAFRAADTPRTRSALFANFTADQRLLDTHRYDSDRPEPGIVLPDGVTAFITDGSSIRPYDLDTGERGPALLADSGAYVRGVLQASPDGMLLARMAFPDGPSEPSISVSVIDVADGSLKFAPIIFDAWSQSMTFSADGSRLFVNFDPDGRTVAIDTHTGATVGAIPGVPVDEDYPFGGGVALLPDGRIVLGTESGLVRVVDGTTLEVLDELQVAPATTFSLRAVGDGASVIGSGRYGLVRVAVDPLRVVWQQVDFAGSCPNLVVVDVEEALYCGDFFGRLVERDLASGVPRRTLDAQNGNTGALWLTRGGTELVAFSDNEPVVSRWRLDGSGPITSVVAHGANIRDISPDGDRVLVGVTESTDLSYEDVTGYVYRAVDVATGETAADLTELIAPLFATDGFIYGVVPTPEGMQVGGYDEASGQVIADGVVLEELPEYFSGDAGKRFGLGTFLGDSNATLRRIELVHPAREGWGPGLVIRGWNSSAISSLGERIAAGTDDGVKVYDGTTHELVGEIPDPLLRGVYITPTDDLYVTSLGGELVRYELDTLEPVRTFGGSRGYVQELYSTGDGSIIAVRGGDRTVTLYDTATGVRLGAPIAIPEADFPIVALSFDGSRLALGGGHENGVQVWELDPEVWVDAACRVAGRNLTRDEWEDNIGDLADFHATCPQFPVQP